MEIRKRFLLLVHDEELRYEIAPCGQLARISSKQDCPEANMSLALITGPTVPHFHRRSTEFLFVLSGKGLIVFRDKIKEIHVGSSLIIPPGNCHFTIPKSAQMKIFFVSAPAWDQDDIYLVDHLDLGQHEAIGYSEALEKQMLTNHLLQRTNLSMEDYLAMDDDITMLSAKELRRRVISDVHKQG